MLTMLLSYLIAVCFGNIKSLGAEILNSSFVLLYQMDFRRQREEQFITITM